LVGHIGTLEDQVQRLTEASTMWQIRARQAEEQLKQLTVGNVVSDTEPEPGADRCPGMVASAVGRLDVLSARDA